MFISLLYLRNFLHLPKTFSFHKIYNAIRLAPKRKIRTPVNIIHLYSFLSAKRFFRAFKILLSCLLNGTSSMVCGNGVSSFDPFLPFCKILRYFLTMKLEKCHTSYCYCQKINWSEFEKIKLTLKLAPFAPLGPPF